MKHLDLTRLKNNLESRIGEDVASGRVGGAVVAVRQEGKLLYEGGFGVTSPTGNTPPDSKTVFRIASMTKPVTAVLMLTLIEEGKLALDDRVDRFLPAYRELRLVHEENGSLVLGKRVENPPTVLHLLSHSAGIGGGAIGSAQLRAMTPAQKATLGESVSYYAQAGLQFEPYSAVLYSGVPAFDVAAAIAERVADRPFEELLHERILRPCHMVDTTFTPSSAQWERMITMHDYVDGQAVVGHSFAGCVFEDFPTTHVLGGAGLVSTLSDYANFAEMLLQEGTFAGTRILSPASVRLLATPQVSYAMQPKPKRWGLAVKVITDEGYGRLPLGAYGWSGAYGTHFWVDPANRITAVYMKNSQYDGGGDATTANNFESDVTDALKEG